MIFFSDSGYKRIYKLGSDYTLNNYVQFSSDSSGYVLVKNGEYKLIVSTVITSSKIFGFIVTYNDDGTISLTQSLSETGSTTSSLDQTKVLYLKDNILISKYGSALFSVVLKDDGTVLFNKYSFTDALTCYRNGNKFYLFKTESNDTMAISIIGTLLDTGIVFEAFTAGSVSYPLFCENYIEYCHPYFGVRLILPYEGSYIYDLCNVDNFSQSIHYSFSPVNKSIKYFTFYGSTLLDYTNYICFDSSYLKGYYEGNINKYSILEDATSGNQVKAKSFEL